MPRLKESFAPYMEVDLQPFAIQPCVARRIITLSFKMEESTDGTYV
jgi:hypothetical protein